MPQPRTATALLDARGAFKNHPNRKRVDPKVVDSFPEVAPSHLTPLQVKCWHELRKSAPVGVLTGADIEMVNVCACLLAESRSDFAGMATARIGQLVTILGRFGMSPSDRAKLATKPEGDDGEF